MSAEADREEHARAVARLVEERNAERDAKLAALIDRFAARSVRRAPRPMPDRPDVSRWVHR